MTDEVSVPAKLVKVTVWILSAVIAGGGGSIATRKFDPPAYDRFTGTDGENLERDIKNWCLDKTTQRIKPIEKDIGQLDGAVETCRKGVGELNRLVALVERDDEQMAKTVQELLKKVANHDKEAEVWKRKIEIHAQWINHLRGINQ